MWIENVAKGFTFITFFFLCFSKVHMNSGDMIKETHSSACEDKELKKDSSSSLHLTSICGAIQFAFLLFKPT